jgi:hypothetical protein
VWPPAVTHRSTEELDEQQVRTASSLQRKFFSALSITSVSTSTESSVAVIPELLAIY